MKAQLQEERERSVSAETSLLDTQHYFKNNLKELQEKASMLEAALEREVEAKNDVVDELSKVHAELDRVQQEHSELQVSAMEKENKLSQQLAEAMQGKAVVDSDLKNARSAARPLLLRSG